MGNSWNFTNRQELIDTYLKGAVALYGFVTPRHFLKIFNKYEGKLLKAELMKYANKLSSKSYKFYCIYENAIISTMVSKLQIDNIIHFQQGKNFYIPTKEELLNRADPDYYDKTVQVHKLHNYFVYDLKVSPIVIDNLMRKIILLITYESRLQETIDLIESFGISLANLDQLNTLFKYITELSNNTRKWANCGFTPMEISNSTN